MDDLISRRAAIEAIEHLQMPIMRSQDYGEQFKFTGMAEAREAIIGLPSAQPALDEWCTDCKEYDQERHCCPRWNRVIRTALDDARKELSPVQPEIIMCRDCRWQKDQSGSTAWLPCMALVTPSDFYCGRAERRTDEPDDIFE